MNKIFLAIESSFDDLSAGVVKNDKYYEAKSRASNGPWGGGVPEINARHHCKNIDHIVDEVLKKANITLKDVDVFSATVGPGIQSGLLVGYEYVKFLAQRLKKPFIPIHHMEAHLITAMPIEKINNSHDFLNNFNKSLSLLISGGHSMIVINHGNFQYEEICNTLDDAIGEVFDKIARDLGLGFPGGPIIEKIATKDYKKTLKVPIPNKFAFSFSGVKTALKRYIMEHYDDKKIAFKVKNILEKIIQEESNSNNKEFIKALTKNLQLYDQKKIFKKKNELFYKEYIPQWLQIIQMLKKSENNRESLLNLCKKNLQALENLNYESKENIAALTQNTLTKILIQKIQFIMKNPEIKQIVEKGGIEVSGGVAANSFIKKAFQKEFPKVRFAPKSLCGDNGIMIALCAKMHWIYKSQLINKKIDIFSRKHLSDWSKIIKTVN